MVKLIEKGGKWVENDGRTIDKRAKLIEKGEK